VPRLELHASWWTKRSGGVPEPQPDWGRQDQAGGQAGARQEGGIKIKSFQVGRRQERGSFQEGVVADRKEPGLKALARNRRTTT
jgi:hypothetical protein